MPFFHKSKAGTSYCYPSLGSSREQWDHLLDSSSPNWIKWSSLSLSSKNMPLFTLALYTLHEISSITLCKPCPEVLYKARLSFSYKARFQIFCESWMLFVLYTWKSVSNRKDFLEIKQLGIKIETAAWPLYCLFVLLSWEKGNTKEKKTKDTLFEIENSDKDMYRAKYNRNHEQANFLLSDLGRNVFLLKEADYYGNIYIFFPWGWQEIFTVQSEEKKNLSSWLETTFPAFYCFSSWI